MPRERITPNVGPYEVGIGWNPDREVQIGVCESEGRSLLWTFYGDNLERIGKWVRDRGDYKNVSDEELGGEVLNMIESNANFSGAWATLDDRADCNRIIKVLRRARDSAFGRDE